MLDQLRQGAQGWVSKLLMALADPQLRDLGHFGGFQGYQADRLASVGDAEVTVRDFSRVYDQARRNAQQQGRQVNPDQVLQAVMLNAALDDAAGQLRARRLGRPGRGRDRQEPRLPEHRRLVRSPALHHDPRQCRHEPERLRARREARPRARADRRYDRHRARGATAARRGTLPAAERGADHLLRHRRQGLPSSRSGRRATATCKPTSTRTRRASARPNTASWRCSRLIRRRLPMRTPYPMLTSPRNTRNGRRA